MGVLNLDSPLSSTPDPIGDPARWSSVHVTYHDVDATDGLLLDAVRPLLMDLAATGSVGYFVRHWRQGPHVRLNLRVDELALHRDVSPLVDRHIGDYLARRPSIGKVDPQALLAEHQRLAESEQESGPLLPWRPDNTAFFVPYVCRRPVLGTATSDLVTTFSCASSEAAFTALRHLRENNSTKTGLAFDLLLVTAHIFAGAGLDRSALSFRSHAEAYLSTSAPIGLRAAWDERYRRSAGVLVDRVAAVVDDGAVLPTYLREWVDTVSQLRPQVLAAAKDGLLAAGFEGRDDTKGKLVPLAAHPLSDRSLFHRALDNSGGAWEQLRDSTGFITYRMLLNFGYLHLTRLGVRPVDRFFVCHLMANAIAEVTGVDNRLPTYPSDGLPTADGQQSQTNEGPA
jgi:hypothetical protein